MSRGAGDHPPARLEGEVLWEPAETALNPGALSNPEALATLLEATGVES